MTCLTNGIDHLGLSVADLAESSAFFIECLGWKQFGGNQDYPAIYVTDGHSKLTLWQINSDAMVAFDRKRNIGLHHLAFNIKTENALQTLFKRVKNWPKVVVEFKPEYSGNGPKIHFMIYEPSGNRIEFAFDPR